MKFTVNSKMLQAKLAAAFKAIPQRSPLQILNNFLFRLADGKLTVTASDTENMVSASLPVDTLAEGMVCIDAKFITSLIKNIANVPVTFSVSEGTVTVATPSGKYRTPAVDPQNFPCPEPISDVSVSFTAPSSALLTALQRVSFACSTDDFQLVLTGVCMDCKEDRMTLYSTDTRLLAKLIVPGRFPECRVVIPAKAVQMLSAMGEGDVSVRATDTVIEFSGEEFILRCQLINGRYPDCERVIGAATHTAEACIDRQSLLAAIRRVSVCADSVLPAIRLAFTPGSVSVSTNNLSLARDASEDMACAYSGDEIKTGFSADYLVSALSNLDGEDVVLRMSEPARPALLSSAEDKNGEFTLLCMPINLVG